jgi:rhodanese-related sulfurtransferase
MHTVAIIAVISVLIVLIAAGCAFMKPSDPNEYISGGTTDNTDPSAPKVIESEDMTSFSCYVNLLGYDTKNYPEITELKYTFEASLENDGAEKMAAIQDIVKRYDFAQFNGISRHTAGLPDHFGATIDISYASGERIYAYHNQDMYLPIEAVCELVVLFRGNITFTSISMDEAAKIMTERDDYVLLDVRTDEEYDEGHLPGAYIVPLDDIWSINEDSPWSRDQLILVYCRSGRRSKLAAEEMCKMGYTNVVEIGGIIDWKGEIEK